MVWVFTGDAGGKEAASKARLQAQSFIYFVFDVGGWARASVADIL